MRKGFRLDFARRSVTLVPEQLGVGAEQGQVGNMSLKKFTPQFLKSALRSPFIRRSSWVSQAGQDFWVSHEVFNEMSGGYFVDIGANDGIHISNTFLLEQQYNWSGICIEANPIAYERLKHNRRAECVGACLDASEGVVNFASQKIDCGFSGIISMDTDRHINNINTCEVIRLKTTTLVRVLKQHQAPHNIDYLSIDVEGAEERVLGGFDFNEYQFKCMTIERPSQLLRMVLNDNEYILIKEIPNLDCFYVNKSFLQVYLANCRAFYNKRFITFRWR